MTQWGSRGPAVGPPSARSGRPLCAAAAAAAYLTAVRPTDVQQAPCAGLPWPWHASPSGALLHVRRNLGAGRRELDEGAESSKQQETFRKLLVKRSAAPCPSRSGMRGASGHRSTRAQYSTHPPTIVSLSKGS